MGASSVVKAKSPTDPNDVEQPSQDDLQPPRLNVQDIENNNNHIIVNPHERFLTFVDECDFLNNNTSLTNNNYLTVAFAPTSTTTTATLRINDTVANKRDLQNQSALINSSKSNRLLTSNIATGNIINEKKKMQNVRESPKKSPKKQNVNEKIAKENEKKKKKKEKPKAPRAPTGGGGNVGRGRGMAEQDQLMRRPRRKLNNKAEKYEFFGQFFSFLNAAKFAALFFLLV